MSEPIGTVTLSGGGGNGGQTWDFLRLRGQPQAFGTVIEPFDRPGMDGVGARKISRQGRPFVLVGLRDFESMVDAADAGAAMIEAMQGETCTITDSSGREWENMLCLSVRPREPVPVLLMVGGFNGQDTGAVCEFEMEFVRRS